MGGPTDILGEGYDPEPLSPAAPSLGLPDDVGLKAPPVLPPTLSEQLESLPSRSTSSDCRRRRKASSLP